MKKKLQLLIIVAMACCMQHVVAQPLVYDVENSGSHFAAPTLPAANELPVIKELPNPFSWFDGSGSVSSFADWEKRRNEISSMIQHYGIGEKPAVSRENIKARMDADTIYVEVTVGDQTLTLRSWCGPHWP